MLSCNREDLFKEAILTNTGLIHPLTPHTHARYALYRCYYASHLCALQADNSVDIVYDNYGGSGTPDKAMRVLRPGGVSLIMPVVTSAVFASSPHRVLAKFYLSRILTMNQQTPSYLSCVIVFLPIILLTCVDYSFCVTSSCSTGIFVDPTWIVLPHQRARIPMPLCTPQGRGDTAQLQNEPRL